MDYQALGRAALDTWDTSPAGADWQLSYLSAGWQADVFLATRPQRKVIVKVYRGTTAGAFQNELTALVAVNESDFNFRCDGWNVRMPRLLYDDVEGGVLILEYLPGIPLWAALLDEERARECSHAIVFEALRRYWETVGRAYGDVGLRNILFDSPTRTFGFIDPGYADDGLSCPDAPARFAPRTRDLAFFLYEISSENVRLSIQRPHLASRHRSFARDFVARFASHDADWSSVKDEILACLQIHYARRSDSNLFQRLKRSLLTPAARSLATGWLNC